MRRLPPTVLLLLLFGYTAQVLAWGPTGHRAIGAIAEKHLTKKARKAVQRILGTEDLAIASTWMDDVRSDDAYDHTHDWHWVTIADGSTYAAMEKNPDGDVVETIGRMRGLLLSDTATAAHKREALRTLVHLIGDMHQPLHVGRGDDKGGNDFQVQWFKKGSNLHRVWDSEMIERKDLSYTELAASLDHATASEIASWQAGSTAQWAEEALQYRARIYPAESGTDLGYEYLYQNWSLVEQQLLKGGIRLAGVLNEAFR